MPFLQIWNFIPRRYMGNPGWHAYYVNESRNVTIIHNTTIINNYSGTTKEAKKEADLKNPEFLFCKIFA